MKNEYINRHTNKIEKERYKNCKRPAFFKFNGFDFLIVEFILTFMIFSQIRINPFSMKVVSLLKCISLVFFTMSATTIFIDTYRGIDGMFTFMGLTIEVVSLLFFILCFSTLILGDILTEIVRIKDESDYII